MLRSNQTTEDAIETKISEANQVISRDYTKFINTVDEIRKIMPANEIYLLNEKINEFDRLFQTTVNLLRQHLRGYVTANIEAIIRQNEIDEENLNREIAEAQRLMGIDYHNDNHVLAEAK